MNRDQEIIKIWSCGFRLAFSSLKCQAVIVDSSRMINIVDLLALQSIIFNISVIQISPRVKDLGYHIDATLDWRTQMVDVCRKITGTLRSLSPI